MDGCFDCDGVGFDFVNLLYYVVMFVYQVIVQVICKC